MARVAFRLSGAPIPFSGEDPNVIAVGDFTGDGVEDLAFASGGSVNVLLGNGSGGFAPAPGSPFAVAGYARSVATGDFNRDGRSDLAVTTLANQVAIYLATGDGQFQEAEGSPLPPGEGSASIVATDLSGNGRTDLAIANEGSDNVTVLLGNGSGGFTPAEGSPFTVPAGPCSSPSMPGMPQSIAAGDFSGKGNMDLAIANFNGSSDNVAILQGNGRGGFTNAIGSPFPANGNPRSVVVGDFNGDGRPDLAVGKFIPRSGDGAAEHNHCSGTRSAAALTESTKQRSNHKSVNAPSDHADSSPNPYASRPTASALGRLGKTSPVGQERERRV